ncbi:hypothetical protein NCPPB940_03460 [Xanthomonas hortorum pv. taraxaci]|nr:hypothetical protein NCPPB940_03460 [Xanthomonas hortorum pv. taraxaci]CAD0302175.1 hypothetical protein NCPPB940_03460 [Xanthomonas hortorum pv. taraxaci]
MRRAVAAAFFPSPIGRSCPEGADEGAAASRMLGGRTLTPTPLPQERGFGITSPDGRRYPKGRMRVRRRELSVLAMTNASPRAFRSESPTASFRAQACAGARAQHARTPVARKPCLRAPQDPSPIARRCRRADEGTAASRLLSSRTRTPTPCQKKERGRSATASHPNGCYSRLHSMNRIHQWPATVSRTCWR